MGDVTDWVRDRIAKQHRKTFDELGGVCDRWFPDCDCLIVCVCGDMGKEPPWDEIPERYHMAIVNFHSLLARQSR